MSEQVQKLLSQLVKTQLEKKSSKKTEDRPTSQKHVLTDEEIAEQENKAKIVEAKMESCAKIAESEKWGMYRQLILENIFRFLMILAYCVVAAIAIFKFGILIITYAKAFMHGIFVAPSAIPPK